MLTKAEFRRTVRDTLETQPQAALLEASEGIRAAILALPEWQAARSVGLFAAQTIEPLVDPLLEAGRSAGKIVCFPKVHGRTLHFLPVETAAELAVARWNLREPGGELRDAVAPDALDLLLVPGLAFDPEGHRLGRGGGFYDRFLETTPHTVTVGVCFSFQILPALPREPHDLPVRMIASETRVLRPPTE